MKYLIDEKDIQLVLVILNKLSDTNLFTPSVYAQEIVPLSRRISGLERYNEEKQTEEATS